GAPAERLHRYAQIALEAHGIGDVPAVHAKALLRLVDAVGADHLRQAGIGRGEFEIARLRPAAYAGVGELPGHARIEIIGAAKIILGAGAADGRNLTVAVDEELDLALAPPAIAVRAPGHVGADIVAVSGHAIEQRVDLLVRYRIGAAELG